jgi:hypothetical protein
MINGMPADEAPARRTKKPPDPLASVIEEAKELERDASKSEVDKRFEVAKLAKKVRDDAAKYGDRGVDRLARALGRDRTALYRAAKIATHWTKSEVVRLADKPGKHGLGISWSHLEVVADEGNKEKRDRWLKKITADGLSVRALKRFATPRRTKAVAAEGGDPVATEIGKLAVAAFGFEATLKGRLGWLAELSAAPRPAAGAALDELGKQLTRLRVTVEKARASMGISGPSPSHSDRENKG